MAAVSIVCFVVWLYLLRLGYRANLGFFKFIWGSVGLFIFLMIWFSPAVSTSFSQLVAYVTGLLGKATHFYESFSQLGIIFVPNSKNAVISLYVDLECSGIIEILAFTSMLWFFPVYNWKEKLAINALGVIWIFIANILRVFLICMTVYFYGSGAFYVAHSILGRLVFYGFSIALYFIVFTKSQIFRQKTGGFHYAGNH